ncbi:MAG: hypothetical protein WC250_00800 [Candidatus Paceibacterota bacterium]|jgi:hypothetical protein
MTTLNGLNHRAQILFKKRERLAKELHEANLAIIQNRRNAAFITSNRTPEGRRARKNAIATAVTFREFEIAEDLFDEYLKEDGASLRFQQSLIKFFHSQLMK